MHFGFMDVISLHSGHQHVSATQVAIIRVVRARIKVSWKVSKSLHILKIIQWSDLDTF
jgi:hypothetical protein